MTANEIYVCLRDMTIEKYNQCKIKLEAVSNKTEKKALQIELGMYNACLRAGFLHPSVSDWNKLWETRKHVIENMLYAYPRISETFYNADESQREIMMAAIHSELFIRNQLFDGYLSEYEDAKSANDAEKIFELQIKVGGMKNVFDIWEAWRVEKDIYPGLFSDVENKQSKSVVFYQKAYNLMEKEIVRLCNFTESLEKDPEAKESQIAEYKCAKYRYAAISRIQVALYQCYRLKNTLHKPDFLIPFYAEMLERRPEYLEMCDKVEGEEKHLLRWYLSMVAYAEEEIAAEEANILQADDWEKIEIQERIDGFRFAKQCLEDGWNER